MAAVAAPPGLSSFGNSPGKWREGADLAEPPGLNCRSRWERELGGLQWEGACRVLGLRKEGKGWLGVCSSFLDVFFAILVKFLVFLLVAAETS